MDIQTSDYEKLGAFYLGREYDLESQNLEEDLVLYDSKDLVTHGVVLGMTGSGKTGLCISLLEEAAMDGVPAIIVDPKGDISNLLLTFPNLEASDFEPWVNPDDARKKERTVQEHAAKTAAMWKGGLGDWGQGPDRIAALKEKIDVNVFTPGSKAGIPVSILSSLEVPPFEVLDDGELLGERIESTVSSLLALVGVDADPIQSPEAVFLGNVFQHCWAKEQSLTLESLIRNIQRPEFDKIGVLDLDSFLSAKKRQVLAMKFNSLLASPGFATWLQGPSLNIQNMLYTSEGKPRMSIFSIAHLSDAERMFFVSLLLNQMLGWMRSQNGTTSLRALFYMDEVFGYLPPTANPPTKKPLMTMLKQGRAFGLGCLLATQNPVDLDYKALSNIGTWWLGRLQTERDQMRVLDGLESASADAGGLDRKAMEKALSSLQSRVFVMNNVHEEGPVIMHVRWVMSYLCGPISRKQIKALMDPKRDQFSSAGAKAKTIPGNPMAMSSAPQEPAGGSRPLVGKGVTEYFVPFAGEPDGVIYKPALLRQANVHFSSTKAGVDGARMVRTISEISDKGIDWESPIVCAVPLKSLDDDPRKGVGFEELPGFAMSADNYKPVEKDFAEWLYRNERVEIFYSPQYKAYSQMGEGEGDFRARLAVIGREARDEAVEKMRDKYEKKIDSQMSKLRQAELRLDKEEAEASSATWQAGASVIGGLLGGLFGARKRSRRSGVTSATRAFKQRKDVGIAKEKISAIQDQIDALEAELAEEIEELNEEFDAETTKLDTTSIKPYKKDIDVQSIALLWLPYSEDEEPVW